MRVRAPEHMRPVDGVTYDEVPTKRLPPPASVRKVLGPRRPWGWVLQKSRGARGAGRAVLHAVDCQEAPQARRRCPWSGRWMSWSSPAPACASCAARRRSRTLCCAASTTSRASDLHPFGRWRPWWVSRPTSTFP